MSTFTNTVRKLTVDECDRQKLAHDAKKADDIERLGFFSNSMSNSSLWRMNGSAGRAVTWLEEIDVEHPDAPPQHLVEQLEMRIEDEISTHPRTFTVKHLHGVLGIARAAAEPVKIARTAVSLRGDGGDIEPKSLAFIDADTWARSIKRPWWRRAGTVIATWWLHTWHAIPYITSDAMLIILIMAAAFVIILTLLIPSGAN